MKLFKIRKFIIISFIYLLAFTSLLLILQGCCGILNQDNKIVETAKISEKTVTVQNGPEEVNDEDQESELPDLEIGFYQQSCDNLHFEIRNPVYFYTFRSSKEVNETYFKPEEDQNNNPDKITINDTPYQDKPENTFIEDNLIYEWQIEGKEKFSGEKISYIFNEAGDYEVSLTISNGETSTTESTKIRINEVIKPVTVIKSHNLTVKTVYSLINAGPGKLKNVTAYMNIPQTFNPLQEILGIKFNTKDFEQIFDSGWNLVSEFSLPDLNEGAEVSIVLESDVILSELAFNIQKEKIFEYGPDDNDIQLFTGSDQYIESDAAVIRNIVYGLKDPNEDPFVTAEKLYNYVIDNIDYDYEKLEQKDLKYHSATEVLNLKKGICMDYSVLYAALCRAAGIPAKIITGIPVLGILQAENQSLRFGHAWVEIKLPSYGWVPVDITHEKNFLSDNYSLNLKTYEGPVNAGKDFSNNNGNTSYFPPGFSYSWEGNTNPSVVQDIIHEVEGLDIKDIGLMIEAEFLNNLYHLLGEYNAAINHVNNMHGSNYIFNDPEHIALEQTLLAKFKELSEVFINIHYPKSYESKRNELVEVLKSIDSYKSAQIDGMEKNDYNMYTDNYNKYMAGIDTLFKIYNQLSDEYNRKYN